MKNCLVIACFSAALAGCAAAPEPQLQAQSTQAARCISLQQVAGRRVLSDGSVLFEGVGPFDFRNRLASQCPGAARIARSAVVSIVEPTSGNQLCRGDRIRITDPVETGAAGTLREPSCILGDFEAVSRR
jgi:hypothetical protein